MRNDIVKKIAQIYQDRRYRSINDSASVKEDIFKKYPALRELEEKITFESAQIATKIIGDGIMRNSSPEREKLISERNEYLRINNIPEDYDKIKSHCSICNDTGFIDSVSGNRCVCYKKLLIPLLFEYSNFSNLSQYTFKSFNINIFSSEADFEKYSSKVTPQKQMESVRESCLRFIKDFPDSKLQSLFFIGSPGTGKTFIAGCIANELIIRGHNVLYLSAPDLFEHINEYRTANSAFSPDKERVEKTGFMYDSIMNCDLLIIDDLGTETFNASRQPELLTVINHRVGSGKKMLITTNLNMQNLMNFYDERLISRIYGYFRVLKFYGDDLRFTERMKRNKQ